MRRLRITWFGHSTFLLQTPGGRKVLFDPWFTDNPACPAAMKKPPKADLVIVSHGHGDHMGDLLAVARDSGAPVVGIFELCEWLRRKGVSNLSPMNKGGAQHVDTDCETGHQRHDSRHRSSSFCLLMRNNEQAAIIGQGRRRSVRRTQAAAIFRATSQGGEPAYPLQPPARI